MSVDVSITRTVTVSSEPLLYVPLCVSVCVGVRVRARARARTRAWGWGGVGWGGGGGGGGGGVGCCLFVCLFAILLVCLFVCVCVCLSGFGCCGLLLEHEPQASNLDQTFNPNPLIKNTAKP